MRRRRTAWFLVSLWMAVITWGSLAPGVGVSSGPDALLHAWAYLILTWLLRHSFAQRGLVPGPVVPGIVAWGFGLLMELIQLMVPSRSGELRDLVANTLGVCLGMLLPVLVVRSRRADTGDV